MDIFYATLRQMLMMTTLIITGYVLRKKKILPENAGSTMAKLESYVFVPALSMSNLMVKCTVESFTKNSVLILYGLGAILASIALAYPLSRLFIRKSKGDPEKEYQRDIYKYALTFGNYGFMGNFIIQNIWGADVFYQYLLFTLFVGIVCHGWGVYVLVPKDQNAGLAANLKKGLFTPLMFGMIIGVVFGLLNLRPYTPEFVLTALENAGKCQGPVAMVLAGFVIGGYNLKEMWFNKKVYVASVMRLIILPAAMMLVLSALGASKLVMTLALVAFATPLGLNTIVYPATYGGDTKTGASMTMISSVISIVTIPLMYLLFIEML